MKELLTACKVRSEGYRLRSAIGEWLKMWNEQLVLDTLTVGIVTGPFVCF